MIQPDLLLKMFSFSAELINLQLAGITHKESLLTPSFEANSLNWTLGHIISSRTYPLRYVRSEPVWTDQQRDRYRHRSANITKDEEGVWPLEILIDAFNESQQRLAENLQKLSYDDLLGPAGFHGNTIAESLVYFHFHETHHAGQLVLMAQFIGKDGVWISDL